MCLELFLLCPVTGWRGPQGSKHVSETLPFMSNRLATSGSKHVSGNLACVSGGAGATLMGFGRQGESGFRWATMAPQPTCGASGSGDYSRGSEPPVLREPWPANACATDRRVWTQYQHEKNTTTLYKRACVILHHIALDKVSPDLPERGLVLDVGVSRCERRAGLEPSAEKPDDLPPAKDPRLLGA